MKLFKKRCYNKGNRHKFKPRYSEKPTNMSLNGDFSGSYRCLKAIMVYEVYECDVCEWCGKVVKNEKNI